jgi:sulfur carrier protein
VKININGAAEEIADTWTVADLVRARADEQRKVAVARNGEVVVRGEWATTRLAEGDQIEVLAPVAGG